jgi:hypothetical protein
VSKKRPAETTGYGRAGEAFRRERVDLDERIEQLSMSGGVDRHRYELVCECADAGCCQRLPITVSEYETIRRSPTLFIVAPGHELPDIETVVARRKAYEIVTRRAEATDHAAARRGR